MDPELMKVIAAVFTVWGVAVAAKAYLALTKNTPYVFGWWDGGMMRAGKHLNRTGKQIKIVVGVLMTLGCVLILTGAGGIKTGATIVMGAAVTSVISDLMHIDKGEL